MTTLREYQIEEHLSCLRVIETLMTNGISEELTLTFNEMIDHILHDLFMRLGHSWDRVRERLEEKELDYLLDSQELSS